MRITFKLRPRETGLRAVRGGPRSYDINVDGKRVGSVAPRWRGYKEGHVGWYFVVSAEEIGPYVNTCEAPVETADDAKRAAKAWILSQLGGGR